jgi:hypothetical protein
MNGGGVGSTRIRLAAGVKVASAARALRGHIDQSEKKNRDDRENDESTHKNQDFRDTCTGFGRQASDATSVFETAVTLIPSAKPMKTI